MTEPTVDQGNHTELDESIFRFVKPRAFISTSLRRKDEPFVELTEKLARKHGFQPYGTVGRHIAAPIPIVDKMLVELQNSDCSIIAATPRYLQYDVEDNQKKEIKAVTEMIHVFSL